MNYRKHYKYFLEIVKFWANEYVNWVKFNIEHFPGAYKNYEIESITYNEDTPYTYYIHMKDIDNNWVFVLHLSNVKYVPEISKHVIEIYFSAQYLPTVNKIRYSEANRDLKFVTYISYKLNKDFTISNLAVYDTVKSDYPGEMYDIVDLIITDPWVAIYLSTYSIGNHKEYKSNKQMRKEAKKYVKEQLKNEKLEYNVNLKLTNYTIKLLEKDFKNTEWCSDKVPDGFNWSGIENGFFAIWDNGENVSPRFDVVLVNDKLIEAYHEEDKLLGLKPRDIYCISITDDEDNSIEKYYQKLSKRYKNIFIWRSYSIYVCTSNYYTKHCHWLKEYRDKPIIDNDKVLDWKYNGD